MHGISTLLLAAAALFAVASAAAQKPPAPGLRLIKTSPTDAGTWLSESAKFDRLISKRIPFFDVTDTQDLEAYAATAVEYTFPAAPRHQRQVARLLPQLSVDRMRGFLETYTQFYTRYYLSDSGVAAADWLYEYVVRVASVDPKIRVERFVHPAFNQTSVIATVPGRRAKTVVNGAHLDSVNGADKFGRSPGADDNASGTAAILESLHALASTHFRPLNTLEFHWYAAEEGGDLGSRDIFRAYAAASRPIGAFLNIDMAGYTTQDAISVVLDNANAALSAFVQAAVREYTGCRVVTDVCGYACSDHASANASGYPSAFVFEDQFEASTPWSHTVNDSMANLNVTHVFEFAKLALGFIVEASYF
ncbi:hypothetical protein EDC01DRAFT_785483 [Geopyxis carbonaria]|nr:hypothetical protein EDC01DRAFT_785483 [Geopyxis carbonaria]